MTTKREKISACVITFNEEDNIRRCLDSVTWCDEIVIVDSYSEDRTVDICREYTDKIYQYPWDGYIVQRNRIREKASHDWVLFLDADEEVSIAMRADIERELSIENNKYVGFYFPRQVFYLGRWIEHGEWYPDLKLRLFRRALGRSGGEEPHDMVIVDGPSKTLGGTIYHYTYRNLTEHIEQTNRFSLLSAQAKFNAGKRFRWTDLFIRPFFRFLKSFVFKLGFLDGRHGFIIAIVSSFGVAIKYAKVWELELEHPEG